MHPATLITQFRACAWALNRNLEGVDDEIALRPGANSAASINWVVGHLAGVRNNILALTTGETLYPKEDFAAYFNPEEPLTAEQAMPLSELRERYEALTEPLFAALKQATPEFLAKKAPFSPTRNENETMGSLLATLAFHESYHTGQTGILRRAAGLGAAFKPAPR